MDCREEKVRNLYTASCLCSGVSKCGKQKIIDLLLCGVSEYVKKRKKPMVVYWFYKYLKCMCPVGV